jgi:hypothetical protein
MTDNQNNFFQKRAKPMSPLMMFALAALGWFALKQPDPQPQAQPMPQLPQRPALDAHIDPVTLAIAWEMYDRCPNPMMLRDAGARLRQAGFPYAASLLETRAAQIAPFSPPQHAPVQQAQPQAQAQAQVAPGVAQPPADAQAAAALKKALDAMTPEQRAIFDGMVNAKKDERVTVAEVQQEASASSPRSPERLPEKKVAIPMSIEEGERARVNSKTVTIEAPREIKSPS